MVRLLTGIMDSFTNAGDMNGLRSITEEAEKLMTSETIDGHALIEFHSLQKPT